MSFINVFGGGTLQPTDVSYRNFGTIATNQTLVWPINSQTGVDYAARINDVVTSVANVTFTLAPANQISTGYDMLWRNLGSNAFNVLDNSGNVILTVQPGTMMLLYMTDNTTTHGLWGTINFGVGSAAINVAGVAGYGLMADGAKLDTAIQTALVSASPLAIDATMRAQNLVWTGGVGTYNLPQNASVGSNFWILVRNNGTGTLTVAAAGAESVDGSASIVLQPTESCIVVSGLSTNWYTVGRGRSTQFSFTEIIQTVTGGTLTLTQAQAASVVQKYTGTLLSAQTVVLPAVVQVYYVQNATSGAFALTFQSPTPGSTVVVPTGQNAILFCDGVNVVNASTTISGITSLILSQGTAASPSFTYSGDSATGIYQPLTHTIAFTVSGTEVARITTAGINGVLGGTTPALAWVTALQESATITLASAATVNIGAAASNNLIISGVTTITAFDNVAAGICRKVKFTGVLTLTYNAVSLILPQAANITTEVNDEAVFRSLGSGNWECISYMRGNGSPLALDASTTAVGNPNMNSNKLVNLAAGTALTDSITLGQAQNDAFTWLGTAGGTANALTATAAPAPAAYAAGQRWRLIAASTNTGAATFTLGALAARNITKQGATALVAGDIIAGEIIELLDDGTQLELLNPTFASGLGNMQGISSYSANQTLTLAQLGQVILFTGVTAAQTLTLPAVAGVPNGKGYWIVNQASVSVTVKGNATENINSNISGSGITAANTLVLSSGESTYIAANGGTIWNEVVEDRSAALGFPSGTRMPFNQTTAPTGWTKDTTAALNDTAMRIVTGAVGSGGTNAFSTAAYTPTISGSTAGYALLIADIPSHTHTVTPGGTGTSVVAAGGTWSGVTGSTSGATGGGGAHSHGAGTLANSTITLSLKYNDFIIASKN